MKKCKPDIIRQTIDFWQPYYHRTLSQEEVRDIIENTAGFFKILAEWERKAQEDDTSEIQEPIDRDGKVLTRGCLMRDLALEG